MSEFIVCIPIFNDWTAAETLLGMLDEVARTVPRSMSVLLVDDGSTQPSPSALSFKPAALERVEVLPLRRNLGHQRAIALGLTFIYERRPCQAVVVMDGDGEDAPTDVPTLLAALVDPRCAVFAERSRRSEGVTFRVGYLAFKAVHRVLTGKKVEVGNFSVMPWALLERLVGVSEIWNHYAAAVYKARLPVKQVPLPRARRLAGESHMDFVALVTHGLSAISVYGETVGIRVLCTSALLMALSLLAIGGAAGIRAFTSWAIPGWATSVVGLLSVLLVSLSVMLTLSVLFVLQSRDRYSFLPLRDYVHYVLPERTLHG